VKDMSAKGRPRFEGEVFNQRVERRNEVGEGKFLSGEVAGGKSGGAHRKVGWGRPSPSHTQHRGKKTFQRGVDWASAKNLHEKPGVGKKKKTGTHTEIRWDE